MDFYVMFGVFLAFCVAVLVIRLICLAVASKRKDEFEAKKRMAAYETTTNQIELCKKYGIDVLEEMDGVEFEKFVSEVMRRNGYTVTLTKTSGDFGVDIIATLAGKKYVVQCKHYEKNVGIKSVQEVYAGKAFYNADICMVVTNSKFTDAAKELAGKTGVMLWDGEQLVRFMHQISYR